MSTHVPAPSELVITADLIRNTPVPTEEDILRAHGKLPPKEIPLTKFIHVSPGTIKDNYTAIKEGRPDDVQPAIVVGFAGQKVHAFKVDILGPCRILQNDVRQLVDGARVWIETEAEIDIFTTRQDKSA